MSRSLAGTVARSFLGQSPLWYKAVICLFLILNPVVLLSAGPVAAG
jgi:NhaB family Na+:H+ antiporter